MTLAPGKDCKKFGSSCDLSEKFFKEAVNGCGILEKVLARGMEQHNKTLAKTDGKKKARLTGVAKLDDANEAGGKNGYKCTLIITEATRRRRSPSPASRSSAATTTASSRCAGSC